MDRRGAGCGRSCCGGCGGCGAVCEGCSSVAATEMCAGGLFIGLRFARALRSFEALRFSLFFKKSGSSKLISVPR